MDPTQLTKRRARLAAAHGDWLCPICKTALADQAAIGRLAGISEVTRHSECGHIITYRASYQTPATD